MASKRVPDPACLLPCAHCAAAAVLAAVEHMQAVGQQVLLQRMREDAFYGASASSRPPASAQADVEAGMSTRGGAAGPWQAEAVQPGAGAGADAGKLLWAGRWHAPAWIDWRNACMHDACGFAWHHCMHACMCTCKLPCLL